VNRFRSILAVVGIASVLLLVAPPAANAVDPLPPPVDPIPSLPSTYNKTIATGSGQIFQDQIAYNLWVRQQMAAQRAAAAAGNTAGTATSVAKAVPVTGVRPFTAAGAGGVLTAAFMGGWMITDGTLALYANVTGENPLQQSCQWGDFGIAAVEILYPFSSPDCTVIIDAPNFDVVAGFSNLVGGGVTLAYLGVTTTGRICYSATPKQPPASPYTWRWETTTGSWSTGFVDNASDCIGQFGQSAYVGRNASGVTGIVGLFNSTVSSTVPVSQMTANSTDPGRIPSCQLTWPDGSVTTETGTAAQEYQETAGLPLADFSALCNDGFVSKPGHGPDLLPTEIEIGSTREDTGTYAPIQTAPLPELTPDEKKGLTPGTSSGGLVLQRVVGTVVRNCLTWEVSCVGWYTATDNATDPVVSDGYYRCLFNGSPVSLLECSPYRTTFDTQTATPTITDPNTGLPGPWTSGSPGTATGTGTFPSTGANPTPGGGTSTGGGGCTAGWSWNPVDWVLNPLRCAFIPGTVAVTAAQTAVTSSWENSVIGSLQTGLSSIMADFNMAEGCEGLPLHLEAFGTVIVHAQLLAACEEPYAGTAAVVRGLLTVACVITAILAFTRYLGSAFAFASFGNSKGSDNSGVSFK
jgi:hypothetical protein